MDRVEVYTGSLESYLNQTNIEKANKVSHKRNSSHFSSPETYFSVLVLLTITLAKSPFSNNLICIK